MTDKPSPRRRKTRPDLNAERIAAEAMALCDAAGFEAVSFRALARRLGCEAMSLYHYFPSKQHLVDAMVNICLAETPVPAPGPSTRERLHEFCLRYRATALRHPGFAQILVTHRLNHREGLAWLDAGVAMMDGARVPDARKATLFRVLSYFVTGAAIDEALGYAAGPSSADPMPVEDAARDFPRIAALGAHFGKDRHLGFYEDGLGVILDWIEAEL